MNAGADAAAAPAATPSPTPPPTATSPPPSPAPLPDSFPPSSLATAEALAPASLLEQAAYLHRIGDYNREQQLLETALAAVQTAPAQPRETTPASLLQDRSALLYQLALSYLADGQPAAALDALERLQRLGDLLPADSAGTQPDGGADAVAQRMINGIFLRAEALAAVGRSAEAVTAYRAFLEKRPRLIDVVEESIAAAWLAAGELSPAAGALRQAANHAVNRREQTRLLDRLAGVLENMERWNEAASVYDEILNNTDSNREGPDPDGAFSDRDGLPGFGQWPIYRAGFLYRAGIAYAAAGDEETAVARWKSALTAEPASEAAYFSLVQLVNRNLTLDLFLRGEVSLFAQAYLPATYAFERL
ncbi:MAG: tetratricopeptide repeat protein, partial [Caldilineaceae bacterium]|nr:tetratricopeptide repeat protein [Caldilineaceae bacterium]